MMKAELVQPMNKQGRQEVRMEHQHSQQRHHHCHFHNLWKVEIVDIL
jgi:hypothetical protein